MDAYDAKYTRRGTERIIKRGDPQNPTEGFVDLMGQAAYDALCEQAYIGRADAPNTFLKQIKTQGVTAVCGFIQAGPRRIFFTLSFWDAKSFAIDCYGCDPVFATPPQSRVLYEFEPLMAPDWSFQMRLEVTRRYEQVRATHDSQLHPMNIALHFGDTLKARVVWETYAAKHGLKIVAKEIKL